MALVILLLTGCAGSQCRTQVGDPGLTPSLVSTTDGHIGEAVQWGGVLIASRNLQDSTELEVMGYPLDSCGRPLTDSSPVGRFVMVRPGFLETTDFESGRRLSATGRIIGVRDGRLGEAEYRFPLLESYKIHLWPHTEPRADYRRPWVNIGIGGGSGGTYGGIGVYF
jgi:outer membrane lipoprotein